MGVMSLLNIFLAEDDPVILIGFKMMIQNMGHSVVGEAMDGESALLSIPKLDPDLMIMDINMPKLDGISVLEKLNADNVKIPCIFVTGYRDPKLVKNATEAGVLGYLQKPIDEYDLKTAIGLAMKHFADMEVLRKDAQDANKALEDRKIIDRAKGMLMESFGLKESDALKALQKKSRDTNRKLVEVARDMLPAGQLIR